MRGGGEGGGVLLDGEEAAERLLAVAVVRGREHLAEGSGRAPEANSYPLSFIPVKADDRHSVMAFRREWAGEVFLAVASLHHGDVSNCKLPAEGRWELALNSDDPRYGGLGHGGPAQPTPTATPASRCRTAYC